ncbi:hypothetical protein CHUAL_001191 [Chamberlinius hualienensis]
MGKRKSKRGRSAKRARQGLIEEESDELKRAPHTFVIHRGQVGKNYSQLREDVKQIFEPYTATKLKVRRSNVIKDFVAVSGLLNVTNLVLFTKTTTASYMKLCRLPRGPTITFKVEEYSLNRDIVSSLKRPIHYESLFSHQPFLVLNNFTGEGIHMKLMATMLQNMFPSINVNTVKLNNIRRCALFNRNQETGLIDFRHYAVKVVPYGLSKGVKKIIQSKVPNLSKFNDVTELLTKGGMLSESEVEPDGPHNEVILPQKIASRGNMVAQKSAIRLTELGPRLLLRLIKIEEGLMKGEVLYHHLGMRKSKKEEQEEKDDPDVQVKRRKLNDVEENEDAEDNSS